MRQCRRTTQSSCDAYKPGPWRRGRVLAHVRHLCRCTVTQSILVAPVTESKTRDVGAATASCPGLSSIISRVTRHRGIALPSKTPTDVPRIRLNRLVKSSIDFICAYGLRHSVDANRICAPFLIVDLLGILLSRCHVTITHPRPSIVMLTISRFHISFLEQGRAAYKMHPGYVAHHQGRPKM